MRANDVVPQGEFEVWICNKNLIRSHSMTTEDFYAHALLAALPVAIENIGVDVRTGKQAVVEFAHDYADLLTKKFIKKRDTYPGL
jgi:hypothetical protein